MAEVLDLVCGPASPLPETYQRYRLVAHLGSGGQAEVYRAVRLSGDVASAPVTVKVFRVDPRRPLADELRSWDKGDAVLMDLNNRGVPAICRRADGFYGPLPHRPGESPEPGNAVPYQIYDYLHGVDLRTYVRSAGAPPRAGSGPRLSAVAALRTLAGVLRELHHPTEPAATPVLHMDVKPSNVMVLATGEVRLIDFTGARYWRSAEITQIAYTPESGGPEARTGQVGPSYDVHGFGAVAYFLVTGDLPRGEGAAPPAAHPALAGRPALREVLLAPLADRPGDRPATLDLPGWVDRLATAVRSGKLPETGVDWAEPEVAPIIRAVGRAAVVTGTETDAFQRIERLERELVRLRASLHGDAALAAGPLLAADAYAAHPLNGPGTRPPGGPSGGSGGAGTAVQAGPPGGTLATMVEPSPAEQAVRGRAVVVPKPPPGPDPSAYGEPEPPRPPRPPRYERMRMLRRGGGWTWFGGIVAFFGWSVWAIANRGGNLLLPLLEFALVLAVGAGLFVVLRLVGRLIVERWMRRVRRSARLAHLGTAAYLAAVGVGYLDQTPWVVHLVSWVQGS